MIPSERDPRRQTTKALIALVALTTVAVGAACAGRFGGWCSAPLIVAMAIAFIATLRELLALAVDAAAAAWRRLAPLVLLAPLAFSAARYLHPCESILGLDDQGTYSAVAVNLARTGHIGIDVGLWRDSPAADRWALTDRRPLMAMAYDEDAPREPLYLPAFFVTEHDGGAELRSTFPPGFPVLVASGLALGGWSMGGWCDAALTLLAAALLAVLAGRWFGSAAAVTTWWIATLQPLALWMSATLYAEPSVAVAWLTGALLFDAVRAGGGVTAAAAGVVAWAGSMAFKVDGVAALAAAPVALVATTAGRPRVRAIGIACWLAASVATIEVATAGHGAYVVGSLRSLGRTLAERWPTWTAIASTGIASLVFALTSRRGPAFARWTCAAVLLALAVFAWFVRPELEPDHPFFFWPKGTMVSSFRSQTLVRLGWYLHPLGVLAATVGVAGLVMSVRRLDQAVWLGVGVVTVVAVCYDHLGLAHQPYIMRRFIAYGLGMLVIAMAWVACRVASLASAHAPRRVVAVVMTTVAALYIAWCIRIDEQLARCANVAGLHRQVDAALAALPADTVVLIERDARPPSELGPYLMGTGIDVAMPQRFTSSDARTAWLELLRAWQRSGRTCVLLTDEQVQTVLTELPVVAEQRMTIDYLQNPSLEHARPTGPERFQAEYRLLTLGPARPIP